MYKLETLRLFAETDTQLSYLNAVEEGGSNRAAAKELDIDRRTVDRAIKKMEERALDAGYQLTEEEPKVLLLDIETAPLTTFMWSMWDQHVAGGINGIINDSYMLTWAAKWLYAPDIMVRSLPDYPEYLQDDEDDSALVASLRVLLNQADWVITHNGDKFDIKRIKARLLDHGMNPPVPFRSIDTLKIMKREFGFTSNKLDFLCEKLLGTGKLETGGFDLWKGCLSGDMESWQLMRDYNVRDVVLLEELYLRIRPWDRSHPSWQTASSSDVARCTVCGSENLANTGYKVTTNVSSFQHIACTDCGHHMRSRKNTRMQVEGAMDNTLMNAR